MIVLLNLVNETDVIGRLVKNEDQKVYLADVMKIYMLPNLAGTPVIYCRKFSPFALSYDVTLKDIHILNQTNEYDIDQLVLDYYMTTVQSYKDNKDGRLKLSTESDPVESDDNLSDDDLLDALLKNPKKDLH